MGEERAPRSEGKVDQTQKETDLVQDKGHDTGCENGVADPHVPSGCRQANKNEVEGQFGGRKRARAEREREDGPQSCSKRLRAAKSTEL